MVDVVQLGSLAESQATDLKGPRLCTRSRAIQKYFVTLLVGSFYKPKSTTESSNSAPPKRKVNLRPHTDSDPNVHSSPRVGTTNVGTS